MSADETKRRPQAEEPTKSWPSIEEQMAEAEAVFARQDAAMRALLANPLEIEEVVADLERRFGKGRKPGAR